MPLDGMSLSLTDPADRRLICLRSCRFAMLTTAPWEDIARHHDRQVVVLKSHDWSAWLHLAEPESELLRPLPVAEGGLVREGSD